MSDKKVSSHFVVASVSTKSEPRVYDEVGEEAYTVEQALCLILNKLSKLEKLL